MIANTKAEECSLYYYLYIAAGENNCIHTFPKGIIIIGLADIGLAVRVFANGPGDLGSITGRVIPKTKKHGT